MDISISSSNFVKRKDFDGLKNVVNSNANVVNEHADSIETLDYNLKIIKEQLSAFGKLIDAQDHCFSKRLKDISFAIMESFPSKYQRQLADKMWKILRESHEEYKQEAEDITRELELNIADIAKEYGK